jgi:hypothetical protein
MSCDQGSQAVIDFQVNGRLMTRIFSNSPAGDFVLNPFDRLLSISSRAHLAAPYFTESKSIVEAARAGKFIELLIGLNHATNPRALADVSGIPNIKVRYLTHRFHAKLFIFDDAVLLGSANLTDGGFRANREAVISLDRPEDLDAIEDVRSVFLDLWDSAQVLTDDVLRKFTRAWGAIKTPDPDATIEDAIGRAEPRNIAVSSRAKSSTRLFLDDIRREVYEQYRPNFFEVTQILEESQFHRSELREVGRQNETNRFLNWLRLTHVVGDAAWQNAPHRSPQDRRTAIAGYGKEWADTSNPRIPEDYVGMVTTVRRVFGSAAAIAGASKEEISEGLLCTHAFLEQQRFVKGGVANLSTSFWNSNPDLGKVRGTLSHLVHGSGDFAERLHDVLYRADFKLILFGRFCALELYGTVRPEDCPPMNGRMAKALRFLGFDVKAT